jgi:hypothetical protein
MARTPKPTPAPGGKPAGVGDNSGVLTEQEMADLQLVFSSKIRAARKARAMTKAADDAAKQAITSLFTEAKALLHIPRGKFEEILEAEDLFIEDETKYRAQESARALRLRRQGLPAMQGDLFDGPAGIPDTADEKAAAYAKGKAYGLRGDDPPLKDAAAHVRGDLEAGWKDGQDELGKRMIAGMEAKSKAEAKAAKGKPNLTPAPTPEPGAEDVPDILGGPTADETFDTPEGDDVDHDAPLGPAVH